MGLVKSSSIEVSKIVEVVGFVNLETYKDEDTEEEACTYNDDVGGSISSVGRGGQTRHCVATGTAQGGRRHSQVAVLGNRIFMIVASVN